MSRSPLSYPLNRGADLDGGGVADLQTDVMRFMAILSLCLVAIFALVQSIPPSAPPAQLAPPTPERVVSTVVSTVQEEPEPVPIPLPPPVAIPEPMPAPQPVAAQPVVEAARPMEPVVTAAPPAEPEEEGFTLRFASDTALMALVAREEIGLYAIEGDRAMRLGGERGRIEFWQASTPRQIHEMDASTVPADVTAALKRTGSGSGTYWGVTLTAKLSQQLGRYLRDASGGQLVISADGNMRLE